MREKQKGEQAVNLGSYWMGRGRPKAMPFEIEFKEAGKLFTSSCVREGGFWERKRKHAQAFGQYLKRRWREGKGRPCLVLDHRSEFSGHGS